jgi:hypothetical protein
MEEAIDETLMPNLQPQPRGGLFFILSQSNSFVCSAVQVSRRFYILEIQMSGSTLASGFPLNKYILFQHDMLEHT